MAERSSYYGSLGRQALASSYSTLDGVPFKIATNFLQPPKVISLPVLESSGASYAFDKEYSFETEEAVLAWARARDEAIRKAKQEEAERAAKATAALQEAASMQNEATSTDSDSDDNDETIPNSKADHSNCVIAQGGHQGDVNNQSHTARPAIQPKPPIPKPAPRPGSILKPTPIQPVNKTNDNAESNGSKPAVLTSTSNEGFDITMFEQEADPFDNLELQTINDMEELKVLLDTPSNLATGKGDVVQRNGPQRMNIPVSDSDNSNNTSEGFYELAAPITTNNWVTFDNVGSSQTHGSPALSTDSNKGGNMVSSSDSPISDAGEYVKLASGQIQPLPYESVPNSNVNGVVAQPVLDPASNTQSQQSNPFGSTLPPHLAGSELFKPVLPPIPKPRHSALSETSNNNSLSQNTVDQGNPSIASQLPSFTQDIPKADKSHFPGANKTNGFKPPRPPPPTLTKPIAVLPQSDPTTKMWSSVGPSLADSFENSTGEPAQANPYSRHSREWHGASPSPDLSQGQSSSPNHAEKLTQSTSSTQLWNRYRPLPPAPSPKPSDSPALPQHMGLSDPYHSLTKEAQAFTDRVTSMGFLRAKVARAVKKFGQDEKEVFDHLIAVDTLVEKKFAPLYAELALQSCQNDCEKAERFLTMQSQFEELGFTRENIQDALIKSDMNHDKALDLLTACSP